MPSTALASPGYDGQPAVYLYIAALEVNVLNCRDEERLLSVKVKGSAALPKVLRPRRVVRSLSEPGRWIEASRLETGSAGQAGEPCRRMPAAVRAPRCEPRWGDAEDSGQSFDLLGGESPLPAVAASFGGAHGGVARPAHQLTDPGLIPAVLLAKDPDVRTDDGSLVLSRRDC